VLARQVEGEVLTVDDSFEEAEVVGDDLLHLLLDQDLLAVKVHARVLGGDAELLSVGGGYEEQGGDAQRRISEVVKLVLEVELGVSDELEELGIFLRSDTRLVAAPDGLH